MKDGLLEYNEINLNSSGFDDDSIVSDNDESNEKKNDNFILKTNSHKSIEEDLKVSYDKNKSSLKGDLEVMNPDKKDLNKDNNNEDVMYEDLFSKLYEIPLKFGLSKNTEVITYLLSLFIFSEFLNLEEIEKDKR